MASLKVILGTLAVGADVGGRALSGAYTELRDVLRNRLSGRETEHQSLDAVESESGLWEVRLDGEAPGPGPTMPPPRPEA